MVPPGATASLEVSTAGKEVSKSPIMSLSPFMSAVGCDPPPPPRRSYSSSSSASATVGALSPDELNCWASSPRIARSRARKSEGSSAEILAGWPCASVWPVNVSMWSWLILFGVSTHQHRSHLTREIGLPYLLAAL